MWSRQGVKSQSTVVSTPFFAFKGCAVMTSIYPTFKGFQQKYRGVRSSSQYTLGVVRWNENVRSITMLAESSRSQPPFEKRLDDYLYALNERDDFAMSIIFFHGPCNDGEETANLYFRDWISICQNASGVEVLWPTAWLAEDVPGARIFSATYDLSLKVTSREGRQDYYLIGENLLGSIFLHAQDYEMWSKPVVLVGHSLGGIVIKELLLQAHRNVAGSGGYDKGRVKQFLDNIILIYYYSTPHSGMSLRVEGESGGPLSLTCTPSRIWKNARFLNVYLSRLQQEFRQMSSLYRIDDKRWRKATIGETSMTKWDLEGIHKVLVPEGSWRGEDCDSYMTADADHFSVCKPTSKTSNNYIDLLSQIEACHYQLRITQHVREAITSVIVSRETSLKKLPSLDLASLVDLKEQLPCYPATALHSQVITQHSRSRLPPIEGNINWYRFHRTLARLNARAGL